MTHKILAVLCLSWLMQSALSRADDQHDDKIFHRGADVSFIPQIEEYGGIYTEHGIPKDPLLIFEEHGFEYIRLKLWHTPAEPYNRLDNILDMARRIHARDLKFLLNFHYSDTWADPGHQTKPTAWTGLDFDALEDSVYDYTQRVMAALAAQGTTADMVQIGNEINSGMLWNDGRVGGSYDTAQQWGKLGRLLAAAGAAVREIAESTRVMIHFAGAASNGGCRWFFDNIETQGVEYDIIGLSYYPWWHGSLEEVEANLSDLSGRYNKDIILVEIAYPWTLQWYDATNNIVGSNSQLHPGYRATVDGQAAFLRRLQKIVYNAPLDRGIGVFYWAPEWISLPNLGSAWENLALFDFAGEVLPSMEVFTEDLTVQPPVQVTVRLNTATHHDTLRPYHFVQIRGEVTSGALPDGEKLTWDAGSELVLDNEGGDYWSLSFRMYPDEILFYKFWTGYSPTTPTFQRYGWEGPTTPVDGYAGNRRAFLAGACDTVVTLQYFNSMDQYLEQYWRPYPQRPDSLALYFRVNMGRAMASGRFAPEVQGPVAVRGDAKYSAGKLDWNVSKLTLEREAGSVYDGSFWSGVCYLPADQVRTGDTLRYRYYIEGNGVHGWEDLTFDRQFIYTESLLNGSRDTTLHWVFFQDTSATNVPALGRDAQPRSFRLSQNYPNPFNSNTRLVYSLHTETSVLLEIFDSKGAFTATLVRRRLRPGMYSTMWSGASEEGDAVPSGIYFARLTTEFGVAIRKILLLR